MEKEAKEDEDKWGEQESGAGDEDNEQMEEEVARILGLPLEEEGEQAWPVFTWTPPGVEVPIPAPTLTPTPMPAPRPPLVTENNLFPWGEPPMLSSTSSSSSFTDATGESTSAEPPRPAPLFLVPSPTASSTAPRLPATPPPLQHGYEDQRQRNLVRRLASASPIVGIDENEDNDDENLFGGDDLAWRLYDNNSSTTGALLAASPREAAKRREERGKLRDHARHLAQCRIEEEQHKRKWWDEQIKERDWTMQLMMALLDPTLSCAQKNDQIQKLREQFIVAVRQGVSKIFNSKKSHSAFKFNGYAVGPGEDVYATGGIRFQQVSSSAQASRFFRVRQEVLDCKINGVLIPLSAVVEFGGLFFCASAVYSVEKVLSLGGSDGTPSPTQSDEDKLTGRILQLAKALNLRCDFKKLVTVNDSNVILRAQPWLLKGYKAPAKDMFVLDNLQQLFPDDVRPELLTIHPRPFSTPLLCSQAKDAIGRRKYLGTVRELLRTKVVDLALALDSACRGKDGDETFALAPDTIADHLHRAGLNLRYLGQVYARLGEELARREVIREMVQRAIKVIVRGHITNGVDAAAKEILNAIFSRLGDRMWRSDGVIQRKIEDKFFLAWPGARFMSHEDEAGEALRLTRTSSSMIDESDDDSESEGMSVESETGRMMTTTTTSSTSSSSHELLVNPSNAAASTTLVPSAWPALSPVDATLWQTLHSRQKRKLGENGGEQTLQSGGDAATPSDSGKRKAKRRRFELAALEEALNQVEEERSDVDKNRSVKGKEKADQSAAPEDDQNDDDGDAMGDQERFNLSYSRAKVFGQIFVNGQSHTMKALGIDAGQLFVQLRRDLGLLTPVTRVTASDWASHFARTGTPFSNEEITLKPVVSRCTTYAIPAEATHSALNLGCALNNSDYSDVQFVFPDEGVTCYGHKVILASRSEYFARLFSCGLKESREEKPVVEIKELSSHTFLAMLKYVYINDVDFADRSVDLVELLLAAERFQLGGLKKLCEERLASSFSLPTAIRLLTAFNISEDLRNQCISFVLAHWGELEKTDEFRDLMLYYPDLLQEIYGSLAIEECDITGTGDQLLIESKLQENYMRPSSAALRLRNDQQELHDHPLPDVNAIQDNLNPLMWTAKVRSLMGEEIDEGLSAFTLLFNDDYPNDPPLVRFKCNRSHPNVFSDGFLHHGVLSLGWNCTQTVKDILQKVVRVIRQPMAEYPANLHCPQPVGTSTVSSQPVDSAGHQQQEQEEEESSMQEALEL